jgi:hypothetical protein
MTPRTASCPLILMVALGAGLVQPAGAQTTVPELRAGQILAERVVEGGTKEYAIALTAGQAVRIVANQTSVDVVLRVLAPDGRPIVEVDSPNGPVGPESALVVATQTGAHRVLLLPFERGTSGAFELRVGAIQKAAAADRRRAGLVATYAEASALLERGDPANRAEAARKLSEALVTARAQKDRETGATIGARLLPLDAAAVLRALGLESATGAPPIHYSRGLRSRAESLRPRFTDMSAFFAAQLKVSPRVALAVLSREDWGWVTRESYAFPAAAGDVVLWPAEHDYFNHLTTRMALRGGLSNETTTALVRPGLSLRDGMAAAADDQLVYPVGIVYRRAAGVRGSGGGLLLPALVANVMQHAYRAHAPGAPSHAFSDARSTFLRGQQSKYTALADFSRPELRANRDLWANYGWYQAHIEQRAKVVYDAIGLAFLDRVRSAFPLDEPSTTVPEALERLERIVPGFKEWAKAFASAP